MQWKNPPVNCHTQKIVVLHQRFHIFDCSVNALLLIAVPAHPDFLPRAAASSAAWRFPTVSPHKSSSVPGWMSRQTRRYTHAHSSSLQVHCTTTFCSSLLCTRQAKLHRWSVNLGHYIKTRNEKVWSLQLAVYVVVIHFKSAQGALPQPHVLQSFFICCHLHQFLWNRRE